MNGDINELFNWHAEQTKQFVLPSIAGNLQYFTIKMLGEIGELADVIGKQIRKPLEEQEYIARLESEYADILWYCWRICGENLPKIDISQASWYSRHYAENLELLTRLMYSYLNIATMQYAKPGDYALITMIKDVVVIATAILINNGGDYKTALKGNIEKLTERSNNQTLEYRNNG